MDYSRTGRKFGKKFSSKDGSEVEETEPSGDDGTKTGRQGFGRSLDLDDSVNSIDDPSHQVGLIED